MEGIIGGGFKRKFIGLCVPPLLLALADGSLTVLGQSEIYWSNFLVANEASPGFGALLKVSPWLLAGGAAAWMLAFCVLIIAAPPTPALIISIAVALGHTVGSGSWLFGHFFSEFGSGYQVANAYYLMSACMIGFGVRHAFPAGVTKNDDALDIDKKTRLMIAGTVFAAAALMFLLPLQR